jgi:tRNA-specific 2-thiouridylase
MIENKNNLAGQKIVVGLSGGVDSAVAALLLKEQGADVHALHMTNWEDDEGYCTAASDLQDARQICEQIGVPLHHVNFAREYRQNVFEHFLNEYRSGRTPNPDVLCNREIKFGEFRRYARRLGATLLATGHYARVRIVDGHAQLLKAADTAKDQSYFLHAVSEEALRETLFPLGEMQKSEVREIARNFGLHVSEKKDSTGICFIGERPFREFLASFLPSSPGPIRAIDGTTIGQHDGLMFYTIGQRQGLGVGGRRDAENAPWFVAAKDLENNALIVVQGENELLYCDHLVTGPVHWIGDPPTMLLRKGAMPCAAKVRYRQSDQACLIRRAADSSVEVLFELRQRAVAPGQYAVFYAGERCLGGAPVLRLLSSTDALRAAV